MKKLKKPLSIILAVLMVMSVFIAVPMTASAVTGGDVRSLLSSMEAMIDDYIEQDDWDHADPLIDYYNPLSEAFEHANGIVNADVENAYNAAYTYFTENGGTVTDIQDDSGGFYPDVNNVYRATDNPVEVTVADLQRGDVIVTSSAPMDVRKGDCTIVLVGFTYGEGDAEEGTLSRTYPNDVTLGNDLSFHFTDNYARIYDADHSERYDPVYNNALGNAYMVIGNENGTVYLAGYNFTTYTITWKDYDGSNLYDGQSTVATGAVPYYRWSVSRNSTAQYTYTFTGWTDSSNTFYSKDSSLPAASKDETYTATYSETLRSYTITWKDGNDTTLKSESVAYGTTPSYTGATPTKAEDDEYTYEFNNTWSPSVASVTGNATYTAQFDATPKVVELPEVIKDCTHQFDDAKIYANVPFRVNPSDLLDGAIGDYIPFPGGNMAFMTDTKGYSYKFYDQTGTEIPATISSKNEKAGDAGYGLSADVIVYETTFSYTMPDDIKALYIVATAPAPAPKDLFPQHSVTLGGNIGVNFYIDPAAANADEHAAVSVDFSWNGQTKTVDADYDPDEKLFKATCDVVAAEVACDITAVATVNGEVQAQTDTYSVQDYAEAVYKDPTAYDKKGKPQQLAALAQALLNYGAMAQTVFEEYMTQPVKAPDDIVKTVEKTDFSGISADEIAGDATDLAAIADQLGFKYYTSSLIYLSKNTLRLYFTPKTYQGEMPHVGDFDGKKFDYYYYVDKENIAAADLDTPQNFTIGDKNFTFSALDYAKAVVNSDNMEPEQKNLAKSLYLYNKAANAYFDAAPAPAQKIVDLSTLTGDYEAQNNDVLTGTLEGNKQITIADGATVTLRNANITLNDDASYAGITPLGDATILLEGTNTVMGGYFYPGVYSAEGATLTIDGTGSLAASSNGYGAGIGSGLSGVSTTCGDITINGGTITANGASYAAGIGSGRQSSACGNITINGGTITANGGSEAPGIGSGTYRSSCGNITINGGTVDATGGDKSPAIGGGYGDYSKNQSKCGNITIADTVTKVTATKGSNALNTIGAGYSVPAFMTWETPCGTITIGGVEGAISTSPYTYEP